MNVGNVGGTRQTIFIEIGSFIAPGSSLDEWPLNGGFTIRVYDEDDEV